MSKWEGRTRGGTFGYLFFINLLKKCGITAAYVFLGFVVIYFIPFAPKATKSVWQYGRKILGYGKLKTCIFLIKNYYRLGQILIDKIAIGNGMKDKYNFRFENYQQFLDILNSDKGVIIIGAHVGNWEIGTPFFDDYGKKINIALYDAEYQKIKDILEENSAYKNYKIIPVNQDNLMHVFLIKEALDNKEYVCFQGDRYINEEKLLRASLLGKETDFPLGPFLLAAKLRTNVVFYFAMREKHRSYRFHFTFALPVEKENGFGAEQKLLEQYLQALEEVLKNYPEQWFNYYDFWKLNPA